MGRHSSPNQGPFVRSFVGWIAMWVAIAAITGVAVWFVVNALYGRGIDQQPAVANDRETQAPEPTQEPESEPVVATESPDPVETEESPDDEVKLITQDISVQVLNGTVQPDAGQNMSTRLTDLGFTVVAIEESSRVYNETTVFWSTPEAEDAARALAERFGWVAEPKPENLSPDVSLHVVVGADAP
ncbi:MAG: LytR C-terminal domain-containing protein [Actinomycetota bacterium]